MKKERQDLGKLNVLFVLPAPIPPKDEAHVLARLAWWRRRIAAMGGIKELHRLLAEPEEKIAKEKEAEVPVLYMVEDPVRLQGSDPERHFYEEVLDEPGDIQKRFGAFDADLVICCGDWAGIFPEIIRPFSTNGRVREEHGLTYVTAKGKICALFPMPYKNERELFA